ncbi:MAG TPA: hypothetical protein VF529_19960 [Solirubrobacteraceae bacterium]
MTTAEISLSVDPVAAAIGAAAIVVALIIWWRSTNYPKLLAASSSRALFSVDAAAADRITVLLDGEPVDDVDLVEIDIANNGRAPIRAADFEAPLRLSFDSRGEVLSVETVRAYPPGLKPEVQISQAAVEIAPLLLNPGEGLSLLLVTRGAASPPILEPPRVAGLTEKRVVREELGPARSSGTRPRDAVLWASAMLVIVAGTVVPYLWTLGAMWLATTLFLIRRPS